MQIGADDTELQQIAIELQKPIVIIHPTFGELQYDRRISSYDGHATWDGKDVELSLSCQSTDDPQAALEVALRLFKGQADWRGRANDYVVEDLLALKNESWLEDDEKELSRDEFLARITLESIAVQKSGVLRSGTMMEVALPRSRDRGARPHR